jgi:hypothetical protein
LGKAGQLFQAAIDLSRRPVKRRALRSGYCSYSEFQVLTMKPDAAGERYAPVVPCAAPGP